MAMSRNHSPALDTGRTPRNHDFIVSRSPPLLQKNQFRSVAKTRSRVIERGATWQYLTMATHVRAGIGGVLTIQCELPYLALVFTRSQGDWAA